MGLGVDLSNTRLRKKIGFAEKTFFILNLAVFHKLTEMGLGLDLCNARLRKKLGFSEKKNFCTQISSF